MIQAGVLVNEKETLISGGDLTMHPLDVETVVWWIEDEVELLESDACDYPPEERDRLLPGARLLRELAQDLAETVREEAAGIREFLSTDSRDLYARERAAGHPRYLRQADVDDAQARTRAAARASISDVLVQVVQTARLLDVADADLAGLLDEATKAAKTGLADGAHPAGNVIQIAHARRLRRQSS